MGGLQVTSRLIVSFEGAQQCRTGGIARPSSTNLNHSRPYCVVEVDPLVPVPVVVPVPVPVVPVVPVVVPVPLVVPVLPVLVDPVVPVVVPGVVPGVVPVVVVLFWVASPVFSAVDFLPSHAASGPATARSTIASSDSRWNVATLAKTFPPRHWPQPQVNATSPAKFRNFRRIRNAALPVGNRAIS